VAPEDDRLDIAARQMLDPRGNEQNVSRISLIPDAVRESLSNKIRSSGGFINIGPVRIDSASQFTLFQITCCALILLIIEFSKTPFHPLMLIIAGISLSVYAPIIQLNKKVEKRRKRMLSELPNLMEIIAMGMEAGLSFDSAVVFLLENRAGLIADLFRRARQEIDTGVKREVAYRKVADSGSRELKTFIMTVLAAETQGRPIKDNVIEMAKHFRQQQQNEIEACANKLPTTMLIPIFICIVPPILLIYLLPALQNLDVLFM
jgi:tight adherence protein C